MTSMIPSCVWDYARVSTPEFCNNPLFFVDNLTERQAHVNWENKITPPDDISRGPLWYEEEDDGGRFPLDKINRGIGYYRTYSRLYELGCWATSHLHS